MPELVISEPRKGRKTNTAVANGLDRRESGTRQARTRATVVSRGWELALHLRSLNVTLDSGTPQRIAHFHPTAKTARLLRSWLVSDQSSSYFVVAPYGTGKSLTATFFIQVVENLQQSGDVLSQISDRFNKIDSELASDLRSRLGSGKVPSSVMRGATIALSGFQPHLPAAIKQSLIASLRRTGNKRAAMLANRRPADTMDDIIGLLSAVRDRYCPDPIDRLAIVWDEFGHHLEELTIRGAAADLADVQVLAEFCSRTKRAPMTLVLLLHQGLMRYATNTSVTVQREWKKIEGRFETVQFVDDSKELYQLVSRIVRQMRTSDVPAPNLLERGLKRCNEVGLFSEFSRKEIERILSDSFPLEPITLYLLPRVSSRVAQNERTLFTYLDSVDKKEPVSPDSLYDYFSDAMRADSLLGGSYQTWLETESALHKARGFADEKALKSACLLGLGLVGERSRVGRRLLEFAVSGYQHDRAARNTVDRLIDAKLLLYRRNADSVSIWHGTDLDLRGRLDQEKERFRSQFDHVSYLMSESPPAPWKPIDYNVEYGIERSFDTCYVAAETIITADSPAEVLPSMEGADGVLYVVVAESYEQADEVRRRLAAAALAPDVIAAVPRYIGGVVEVALDVHALQMLSRDTALLAEDPLVESELEQMTDDAQGYLSQQISRMFQPSPEGPEYYSEGAFRAIRSPKELRKHLSNVARRVFPLTPRIKNELIVRRRPRAAIVNARKKLILAILERSGTENLEIEGYRPDMSMFRTVLLLTGLYQCNEKAAFAENTVWRYAMPAEVSDPGLRAVWGKLREYLIVPDPRPKPLGDLVFVLSAAPYGIRRGLIPIFLAAALRAFPGAISITRTDGAYVSDLLPSTIETMAARPGDFQVFVPRLTSDERELIGEVTTLFGLVDGDPVEGDPIRRCHDALAHWRAALPQSALNSRFLTDRARKFGRMMTTAIDPYQLLFVTLPNSLGLTKGNGSELLAILTDCKSQIEAVVDWSYEAADRAIRSALPRLDQEGANLREAVGRWAKLFPSTFANELTDAVARALLKRARTAYHSDRAMADAMAALVVGKPIHRWEDSSIVLFEREFSAVIRRVEDGVLRLSAASNGATNQSVVDIASSRLREVLQTIRDTVGADEMRIIADTAMGDLTENHDKCSKLKSDENGHETVSR